MSDHKCLFNPRRWFGALPLSLLVCSSFVSAAPLHPAQATRDSWIAPGAESGVMLHPPPQPCFPSPGFDPPAGAPNTSLSTWWCGDETEQGFLGFSYDVGACKSLSTMSADFKRMRTEFSARYVRLYSACDNPGFMDDVVSAAYGAGIGVYSLIWFGFTGGTQWMKRRDALLQTLATNPLAPYVIRSIDVGSEPLYDWVLTPTKLAEQVQYVKNHTSTYGTKVAISEMQYGYTVHGNSSALFNAIDAVHANVLPFFDKSALTGAEAGPSVLNTTQWFSARTQGQKKIIFTQTGWPSNTHVWKANSKSATASVASSAAYLATLDGMCEALKSAGGHGGVGWFWQIWSDKDLDGWGLLDANNTAKFPFAPRTSC